MATTIYLDVFIGLAVLHLEASGCKLPVISVF